MSCQSRLEAYIGDEKLNLEDYVYVVLYFIIVHL